MENNNKSHYGGKHGTPNRHGFLLYNIIYGIWNTLIVPYTPAFIIGGVVPSQIVYYVAGLCITSVVWGVHLNVFLAGQPED